MVPGSSPTRATESDKLEKSSFVRFFDIYLIVCKKISHRNLAETYTCGGGGGMSINILYISATTFSERLKLIPNFIKNHFTITWPTCNFHH